MALPLAPAEHTSCAIVVIKLSTWKKRIGRLAMELKIITALESICGYKSFCIIASLIMRKK